MPLGSDVESTEDKQTVVALKVYPGADGDFTLYEDDGKTYAYERGQFTETRFHWSDHTGKVTSKVGTVLPRVNVVGRR